MIRKHLLGVVLARQDCVALLSAQRLEGTNQ